MGRKIPEHHLQTLHDALRLLELISTDKVPFDQIGDIASHVRWFGMSRLSAALRRAVAWVNDQCKSQRFRPQRHDGDTVPERPYRMWGGSFMAYDPDPTMLKQAKRKLAADKAKATREAKKQQAPALLQASPWLKDHIGQLPKPEEGQPVPPVGETPCV